MHCCRGLPPFLRGQLRDPMGLDLVGDLAFYWSRVGLRPRSRSFAWSPGVVKSSADRARLRHGK
eukprot:7900805-Pyramimonas_sp.AAC.1